MLYSSIVVERFDDRLNDVRPERTIQEDCGNLKPGKSCEISLPDPPAELHVDELGSLAQIDEPGLIQLLQMVRKSGRSDRQTAAQIGAGELFLLGYGRENAVAHRIGQSFGDAVKLCLGHTGIVIRGGGMNLLPYAATSAMDRQTRGSWPPARVCGGAVRMGAGGGAPPGDGSSTRTQQSNQ